MFLGKIKQPKVYFPLLALAINLVIYNRWLNLSAIYTYADWGFLFQKTQTEFLTIQNLWNYNGLGKVNVTLSGFPLEILQGFLAHLFTFAYTEKFLYMFPAVIVAALGSYFLAKEQGLGNVGSLLASIVFNCNVYVLVLATGHLNLMGAFAFALPSLLFMQRYIRTNKKRNLYLAFPCMFVTAVYDSRVLYILSLVIGLYFVFSWFTNIKRIKIYLKQSGLWLSGLILLNFFWIYPLTKLGQVTNNEIFNRGLFGSEFLNLSQALTLFHPFWTGEKTTIFQVQPIPIYFWLVPILVTVGIFLNRRNTKVLFFGLIALGGILLTKQADEPFPNLYLWLYQNLPGFNAFREASKFYFLTAVGYSIAIGALVDWLIKNRKRAKYAQIGVFAGVGTITALFLWNALPLLNGKIEATFIPRGVPTDYRIFEQFVNNQNNYFRTLWLPASSKFGYYDNNHPKLDAINLVNGEWKAILSNPRAVSNAQVAQAITEKNYSESVTSDASVKYIVVPLRDQANDDDFFIYYGDIREDYINNLDKLPWLSRIDIGTKDLAVYENKNFMTYFSSFTDPYVIDGLNNLESKNTFLQTTLKFNKLSFTTDQLSFKHNQLADIFNDLNKAELKSGSIEKDFSNESNNATSIYANNNRPVIKYTIKDGILSFSAQKLAGPFVQDRATSLVLGSDSVFGSTPIDIRKQYYVNLADKLLKVDNSRPERKLGVVNQAPRLLESNIQNLVKNPSFESGLWQEKVDDCNEYDNDPRLSHRIDTVEKSEGNQSLILESDKHTACTNSEVIDVTPGKDYLLSFDYKVFNTRQAGYEVQYLNASKSSPLKKELYVNDNAWRQEVVKVSIPEGVTDVRIVLKGYPDDRRKERGESHYDNVRFSELTHVYETSLVTSARYTQTDLSGANNIRVKYSDDTLKYGNKIDNPSLENGLWQKEVGDCSAYDNKPKLGMKLSNERSDGDKSLQLETHRHISCTGPQNINVEESGKYLLSFDYQSNNAEQAGYYISFNDPAHTSVSERIDITDDKWHSFQKTISVPYGATSMQVIVYGYPDILEKTAIINRYDNFFLTEIPDIQDQYYLVSEPKSKLVEPKKIDFELNSPTKKTLHIKGATTPFYLAMSEAYHPQWRLIFNNGKVKGINSWAPSAKPDAVPNEDHIKLNDFQNGWFVDVDKYCKEQNLCTRNADGSYDMEMLTEFAPQRYFYIGLIISGMTLLACLGFLSVHYYKRRKDFRGWSYYRQKVTGKRGVSE